MDIWRRDLGKWMLAALAAPALALPVRPKLLVLVLMGQMRPDTLDAVWPQFGQGGLRRIQENGAFFPDCRNLASTFQASSIATLATGAWPSQHGIVADRWLDPAGKQDVRASAELLDATTLAAQVAASPNSRIYVVSMDPRLGRLFAGTPKARQFWMNTRGQFITTEEWPDWLAGYNRLGVLENLHNAEWRALDAKPEAPPLRVLKFDPSRPEEFLALYRASPFAQEAQFEFVAELIAREKLGNGDGLDFVCLLESATSLLGYETGGRSPLVQQLALRLDQHVEYLLNMLDKTPGADGYDLALVAAHGAPAAPSPESRTRMAVNGEALAQGVNRALMAEGLGKVQKYVYPFLYLDASGFRDPAPVRMAAARAALEHPAVAAYFTADGVCSTRDEWERRFRNSFHAPRSGDVMLSYRPDYIEDYGPGYGVSYGSLYNYDVRVPLFLYGRQFRPGVIESPVESVDVAATLARAVGVAQPSSCVGRVLGQAFSDSDE